MHHSKTQKFKQITIVPAEAKDKYHILCDLLRQVNNIILTLNFLFVREELSEMSTLDSLDWSLKSADSNENMDTRLVDIERLERLKIKL